MQCPLSSRFHDGNISLGRKRGQFACGALSRKDLELLIHFYPSNDEVDMDPNLGHLFAENSDGAFDEYSFNINGEAGLHISMEFADLDSENVDSHTNIIGLIIKVPNKLFSASY